MAVFAQPLHFFSVLWRFSRPHTLIGTFFSISALYVLAGFMNPEFSPYLTASVNLSIWFLTLVSCACCNIYITGLNQWADVELDRINKPWLPVASGELSRDAAMRICLISLGIALLLAYYLSPWLFLLIALISAIGTAYSLPPLRFKKHHFGAATAIFLVRGLLVNIGVFIHYRLLLYRGEAPFPTWMWPLTLFITLFSIAIAWYKDIPDAKGDAAFRIRTLTVKLSPLLVFRLAGGLLSLAYAVLIVAFFLGIGVEKNYVGAAIHGVLLLFFWAFASRVIVEDSKAIKRFYMTFWLLFFLAYIAYPLSLYFQP
jgi:homogentisate phytyltransferase/homogentisate geranylgeranyltransferase